MQMKYTFRLKSTEMNDLAAKDKPLVVATKLEMDRSYEKEVESGFQSSFASASKSESENSWVVLKGEVADPLAFDPPIQSSNIESKLACNISTISGDEPRYLGQ